MYLIERHNYRRSPCEKKNKLYKKSRSIVCTFQFVDGLLHICGAARAMQIYFQSYFNQSWLYTTEQRSETTIMYVYKYKN